MSQNRTFKNVGPVALGVLFLCGMYAAFSHVKQGLLFKAILTHRAKINVSALGSYGVAHGKFPELQVLLERRAEFLAYAGEIFDFPNGQLPRLQHVFPIHDENLSWLTSREDEARDLAPVFLQLDNGQEGTSVVVIRESGLVFKDLNGEKAVTFTNPMLILHSGKRVPLPNLPPPEISAYVLQYPNKIEDIEGAGQL